MQIAIPVFPRLTALDAVGPYEVLSRLPDSEVVWVAHRPGEIRTEMALGLVADAAFADVTAPDVLVFPGGFGTRALMDDDIVLDWVRQVHPGTRFTTSVCTGSLVLAAAGLLDGLEATTHWAAANELEELGAHYVADRVVRQERVITAAGVSSGIDMALHLAALLADDDTARAIQLAIEYDPQPPFDSGSLAKAPPGAVERLGDLTLER